MGAPDYYDKLHNLMEDAKTDEALQAIMKGNKQWNKVILLKEYGFTDDEVSSLQTDLAAVSDDSSLSWWSF